ncbi:hypothetical protein ACQJBY_072883 [Aegilops geniculata]
MAGGVESQWSIRVFERFERSVVRLNHGGLFLGTGFVVYWDESRACLIITCHHVVSRVPMSEILDAYFSGNTIPSAVRIVRRGNDIKDLALLRVQRISSQVTRPPVVMDFFQHPVAPGWDVVLLGYNVLRNNFILEPSTCSPSTNTHIKYSCTSTGGMSGSPIVLARVNKVVGVHFMSSGSTGEQLEHWMLAWGCNMKGGFVCREQLEHWMRTWGCKMKVIGDDRGCNLHSSVVLDFLASCSSMLYC